MLKKQEVARALGLSCVENYFLAWLDRSCDVTPLYGSAFVGLAQVFDDFAHGSLYQTYYRLPRLQDVAEDYGIVTHAYRPCPTEEALQILHNAPDGALCLMRVNTAFFTAFKRASWREDHYVCVDGGLDWLNEYPLSVGTFSREQFAQVYDGALCVYTRCGGTQGIPDDVTEAFLAQDCRVRELPRSLQKLESAVGVLRVARKRMEKFYVGRESVARALREENVLLDKIFFDIRLRQLKEKKGETVDLGQAYEELCRRVQDVIEAEKRAVEEVRK